MYILGVKIDNLSMDESLDRINEFLNDGQQYYIVTPNPEIIMLAQKDKELKLILNNANLSIPDGIGLVWASKLLGRAIKSRVTGTDLMGQLKIRNFNLRVFLLGGADGAAQKIAENWPAAVGFTGDLNKAIDLINLSQPNLLLVGLGAPKQEKWIAENLEKLTSVRVAMGVGGAFDFISGRVRRAPIFMQKLGLEWLWRLILQPRRAGRIYSAVIKFPLMVFKSKFQ